MPKDTVEAVRLLAMASLADNTDAQLEYAIALFNGTGVAKDERMAAVLLAKAARKGNPVARDRLANILAVGRGVQANPVLAIKWHIVAKAGGVATTSARHVRAEPAAGSPRRGREGGEARRHQGDARVTLLT